MNGKDLLEGLSLVEERFVQEAELQKMPGNYWIRPVAAAAACICLLFAGMKLLPMYHANNDSAEQENAQIEDQDGKEMVAESGAAQDPQSHTYGWQSVRTDQILYVELNAEPLVIRSAEELADYLDRFDGIFQLEQLRQACVDYDEEFFKSRDLILAVQEEGSGSVRHQIQGLRALDDGLWELTGRRVVPEVGTCDMAQWHIVVETQKNLIRENERIILSWYE